jgi:tetratricopeptide (TPR) repeat protein
MIVLSVAAYLLWCRRLVATLLLTSLALLCSALIVSISPVAWTPYAERYLYAPLGPMIVGVVFWLGPYCQDVARRKIAIALLAPLLLAFAGTVLWRSYIWQDNLRLYQDTHEKSPDFARVKNELANALAERGRRSEGVALLNESRVLSNQLAVAGHTAVLIENDDLAGARDFLADRLSKTPGHTVEILEELIGITNKMAARTEDGQLKQGYYRDILGWLEQLERLTHNPFHWYRLGRIHLLLGDRVNARRCFAEAARRMPVNSPYHAPAKKLAETL